MSTLYLIRHGESLANAGGITMEHAAIPLTELGHQQAQALAALLPPEPAGVWVSPFLRAQETARPYCARTSRSPVILTLLHEFETIDPDLLQGMTGQERRPIADAYWQQCDPDRRMGARAETFREFARRVQIFCDEHLDALPDGAVLFGHGIWIGMLVWKLLGFSANDSFGMRAFRRFQSGLPMPNGAVYRFSKAAGRWQATVDEAVLRAVMSVKTPAEADLP
ncbi:MAG: histidine phosphatase family protein [Betaproteobacteria bacterium]|nr:histidine phosphatase family protein [Betaproteobacteria bacterium]